MTLLTDSNRPRFTRPLTAMTIAIALAASATIASAAGALALKEPAVVKVAGYECAVSEGSETGAAGANVVTTAKGRWWYLDYWTSTTDSTGTHSAGSPDRWTSVKMDAKNPTPVYGYSRVVAPATTTFYLRLMDRHGDVLDKPAPVTTTCG